MKKIVVYANGSAGNHGCEALTRSIYSLLSTSVDDIKFASSNIEEDISYGLSDIVHFMSLHSEIKKNQFKYLKYLVSQKLFPSDYRYYKLLYTDFLRSVDRGSLYISAGGDNYSYNNNVWLNCLNTEINQNGGKTILLGCSILENISDLSMIKDLSNYSAIIARESISYNALKQAGVDTDIYCLPDPAFIMRTKECKLPEGFIPGNTVGLNISPMIIEREQSEGAVMNNYFFLIDYLLKNTNYNIALIPHVVWPYTDDRNPLSEIFNRYRNTKRVLLISDHNAEELKYIISQCHSLIAARTHASIAAYSTMVPTLVVGYSVKARGIALDIFGDIEHYVIPVQKLKNRDDLTKAFCWLMDNEAKIHENYQKNMSEYVRKCEQYAGIISKYV
ncbi:polysaccharide pyruvyl transferase family protein [uncultured Bacteroides sp.]|uniref:polysaccharide pyruvyl transferase family protein n=1 Tax=uncultured Bacteroides sp. TaxID=162156 RepID=UPI0025F6B62E|nr:polysaccharide pyruvyl transferase family protein [uncultured Bacteroides sp.]